MAHKSGAFSPATLFLLCLCPVATMHSQSVIPVGRAIDWTTVGIQGGIPSANWPVYATLSPSGGADDSVAIQTAINSAPAGSVIKLNPGTYVLHRSSKVCYGKLDDYGSGVYEAGLCLTDKSVVLRGSGANNTILRYGDGANVVSMGRTYLSSSGLKLINITSAATKDSTSIALASVSGISVGTYLGITQTNPTDTDGNPLVDLGYGGCNYCGHDMPTRAMIQIDRVTAVNGTTLTLEKPLYFTYNNSPVAYVIPMIENVGLEDLYIQPTASSGTTITFKNINLEACAHCWVHHVRSDYAVDRSHIYMSDAYGNEISDNYCYETYSHNSGEGYAIFIEFRGSANLIQNNIIRKARHSIVNAGGSGNVWAYNYILDPYMGEYPNSLPESDGHGAHPYMDLIEGNITPNIELDHAHGSSNDNTLFRNYINLTSTNPDTGSPMTGALFAVNFAYYNNYENAIGNVIGPYGSPCTATSYEINADASQTASIYKLGYYDDGGTSSPNPSLSAKVGQTVLRGGNWDCQTNSVIWKSNVPSGSLVTTYLDQQTLPDSLYLSAKPDWFAASGAVWPPIDSGASTKVNKIPAQICYENGPKLGAAFDPSSCYGSRTRPQPPTNLSATVS